MSSGTVNIREVQNKLYEKVKASGWTKLSSFILGNEMGLILSELLKQSQDSKQFCPKISQLFRAFEECEYNLLKVIVLGQDPYPYLLGGVTTADGISFSCGNTKREQPSLTYMFDEIERTVYPGQKYERDPDLKRWSNQGILLINTALTTTIGKVGVHYLLWQPFISFLFDILVFERPDIVFCFLGNKAKEWSESVPDNCIKLFAQHPAAASHAKLAEWNSDGLFLKINQHVTPNIIW